MSSMSSRTRATLIATVAIAIPVAIVIAVSAGDAGARRQGASPPPRQQAVAATPQLVIAYQLEVTEALTVDPAALAGASEPAPQRGERSFAGRLERLRLASGADGQDWLLRVVDARGDGATPAHAAGIVVRVDRSGAIGAVRLPAELSSGDRSQLRELAGLLQIVGAAEPHATTWTAEEVSADGVVTAEYERTASGRVAKRFVALPEPAVLISGGPRHLVISGEASGALEVAFDDDPAEWTELAGERRVVTRSSLTGAIVTDGTATVTASLISRGTAWPPVLDGFGPWEALDAAPVADPAGDRAHLDELAGDATWESLMSQLAAIDELDDDQLDELSVRLAAYLTLHPDACVAAAAYLRPFALDDPGARLLFGALAHAGTPEAQAGLADLARAWLARDERDGLAPIAALGQQSTPSAGTIALLREVAADRTQLRDAADVAELALGSVAGKLASTDPATADAIVASLAEELESGGDRVPLVLDALGNSGAADVLELATPHLDADDVATRGAAAFALRFSDSEAADLALAQRIRVEQDLGVLHRLLLAAQYRPTTDAIRVALEARQGAGIPAALAALVDHLLQR